MTQAAGSVHFNLDGLDEFKRKMAGSMRARVGIIGAAGSEMHQPEPGQAALLTNAEVGVFNQFGTDNIPPRDFLLMPIQRNKREMLLSLAVAPVRRAIEAGNFEFVFRILGTRGEKYVKEAFETRGYGQWAPNAPATIDKKGSSMPLINFGQLKRAVGSDVVKKADAEAASIRP